jgi:hypothetical protein
MVDSSYGESATSYGYEYGRSTVSAVRSVTLWLSRWCVTGRGPVTAISSSKSDVTVVMGYSRGTVTAGSRCEVQLSRLREHTG